MTKTYVDILILAFDACFDHIMILESDVNVGFYVWF